MDIFDSRGSCYSAIGFPECVIGSEEESAVDIGKVERVPIECTACPWLDKRSSRGGAIRFPECPNACAVGDCNIEAVVDVGETASICVACRQINFLNKHSSHFGAV